MGQNYFHGIGGDEPDYDAARTYFEMAAADNHPVALGFLGLMHLRGHGFPEDPFIAFDYFDRGVSLHDHPISWYGLGLLYLEGISVDHDEKEAVSCLQKAADKNLADAQYKLAKIYLEKRM